MIVGDDAVYALLVKGLPHFTQLNPKVMPADDFTSIDDLPLVLYVTTGGSQVDGQEPPSAWDFGLALTVVAGSYGDAQDLAAACYDTVHAWNQPGYDESALSIAEDYFAMTARDEAVFTRAKNFQIDGRQITELNGNFAVVLGRNPA